MITSAEDKIGSEMLSVVTAEPEKPRETYAKAIMHVNGDNFYLDMLVTVYIKRDYLHNHSDYIEVEFYIPLGDFVYHIYPYRDNITMTLSFYSLGDLTTTEYHFVMDDYDENIKNNKYMNMYQDDLNREYAKIKGECTSKVYLEMRNMTEQGIFYETNIENVLVVTMAKRMKYVASKLGIPQGTTYIHPPNNTRIYDHIVIPSNTETLKLPKFLQEGDYGIYNGDVNTYIQSREGKENLYIFPRYRFDLLKGSNKLLFIIGVSALTLTGVNNTYAIKKETDKEIIKIVVPKNTKLMDDDINLKDKGTRDISMNTDSIRARPFEIGFDKTKLKRDFMFDREEHKEIDSKIKYHRKREPTNNLYHGRTDTLKRDGALIQFDWNFSNDKILIPMMPVIYVYQNDDKIYRHEGLLYEVSAVIDNNKRIQNAKITVQFNREEM